MTCRVESFPKPIIAAVNGLAFGGGCELVESTHIALAADVASFSKAEINIGIMPTFGGMQRLPRNIGAEGGHRVDPDRTHLRRKRSSVSGPRQPYRTPRQPFEEALVLANLLATKPPLTLAAALAAIHQGMDAAIDDGLAIEEAAFARIVRPMMPAKALRPFWKNGRRSFSGIEHQIHSQVCRSGRRS